jgi:pyrroline-5-carboxylate reductase
MPARKTKNRGRAAKTPRRSSPKKAARRRGTTPPLVGFIGAGNMARSLAGGLLKNGWARNRLILSDPDARQRAAVEKVLRLKTYAANADVAARADILVLAVKPQALRAAAREVAKTVQRKRPLVVSVAAGVRLADLERWLGGALAIVRVMPNTAALIGSGAAGLYANARVAPGQRDQAESILRSVGVTVWLADESLLDVVTAVSGSGPAYFFRVMEALERAGVEAGLDAATARLLTLETAFGAAKMALEGGEEPAVLRAHVTSPGGTTEQALRVLEAGGIEKLFDEAVRAATRRAHELAEMFGKDA